VPAEWAQIFIAAWSPVARSIPRSIAVDPARQYGYLFYRSMRACMCNDRRHGRFLSLTARFKEKQKMDDVSPKGLPVFVLGYKHHARYVL
jgi:hypothetical protein